jgi:hypothetical protein
MALDTYAQCPGGTGKKIKFCCADLVGDLERIDRLIDGDQISAALGEVTKLEEKHPRRACLMAVRTKLELGSKRLAEAAAASRRFLEAFPDNPLALGQSAVTEAVAGRIHEAATLFDKARDRMGEVAAANGAASEEASPEFLRIAATLVQAAAQTGSIGFAQGIVEWMGEKNLGSAEERRMLAAIVGSSGVPAALRPRVRLMDAPADAAWRQPFEAAVGDARHWRLERALAGFRSVEKLAPSNRGLLTNIALVCETLARPVAASEAWLAVARLPDVSRDDAIEATARGIALESEADPDRSPQILFATSTAALTVPAGEEGAAAIDLLEDRIRHDPRCEPTPFDRAAWVSRGAVPPRSVWRIYDGPVSATGGPVRVLASLLIFGRQTDREPEAVLQGFAPDVAEAEPPAAGLLGCTFVADAAGADEDVPATTPTSWLLGSQFRPPVVDPSADPSAFDTAMQTVRQAVAARFVAAWPDTPLPELLGKTPREAVKDPEGSRRVEAIISVGEATAQRRAIADAWTAIRGGLGLAAPETIVSSRPLQDVPPLRWHRLDMRALGRDELRDLFIVAVDAGFVRAAELGAEELLARPDAAPEERWEALGVLEERAETTGRKLELLEQLRAVGRTLKVNGGMLDVAELRIRLQRGEQPDVLRLLDRLRRESGRDPQVMQALAEALMEAGIDLNALAGRAGAAAGPAAAGLPLGAAPAAAAPGKLWTPGGEQPGAGGEKKAIWTPG